jgi:protoporphyrinogen oxidase
MARIAVVGGGPGGLMTARLLTRKAGRGCQVTVFEASDRLGGKLHTRRFGAQPVRYEAGIAECYDVSAFGYDPLKALVHELGLTPVPTHSETVAMHGAVLEGDTGIARCYGHGTLDEIRAFRARMVAEMPHAEWVRGLGVGHNGHPWAQRTWGDILDQVADPVARHYLRITSHADLATEPHLVNGLVGLRNFLKGVPGYGAQYRLDGGMEMLSRRLAEDLAGTTVRLRTPVVRIAGRDTGGYRLTVRHGHTESSHPFDAVVVALPYPLLSRLHWPSEGLRRAMAGHVSHYDRPGHYLRVSLLFDRPFWRAHMPGSWLMLDAFGGCCVYDESPGGRRTGCGVLAFLLAGADALAHSCADDATLVNRVLAALPGRLRGGARESLLESRVHRWVGALSGTPGGDPYRDPVAAHRPEPEAHRRVAVVGDYLFDSTLNGVLRSADLASGLVLTSLAELAPARRSVPWAAPLVSGCVHPEAGLS